MAGKKKLSLSIPTLREIPLTASVTGLGITPTLVTVTLTDSTLTMIGMPYAVAADTDVATVEVVNGGRYNNSFVVKFTKTSELETVDTSATCYVVVA